MSSVITEFVLVALAAMLSPTTLSFSVLVLIVARRPMRTGFFFYAGALGVTLIIGIAAAFVLGDVAASSHPDTPKTWVAVVDVVAAAAIVVLVVRAMRRPPNPERAAKMIDQMSRVADSPVIAIVGAGATLANPGGFIPLALKEISELNPTTAQYALLWVVFALVSVLPLALALVSLAVAPEATKRVLHAMRGWLERRARLVAAVILVLLAGVLLRNGIAGLTA